jgi:putative ABC transport system permease protein
MSSREPRIVTWFLRLYPESFRRAHGQELVDFVRDELEREARGPARRLTFWLATAIDLTRGAWRAHRPETPAARRRLDLLTIITDALASLRHAWRTLGKTPLITTVIVATLALGVGLNTAIYSVVDAVLLAPFPYQEPDELYYIGSSWRAAGVERANHSGAELDTFRRESRAFEDVAGVTTIRQNLTDSELPRQVRVGWTSTNFFSLLGVDPILGSGFAEDSPPGTLLLSFELWRDRYGRDPEIVGKPVRLDEHPYTVVGVLPRGFELYLPNFPSRVDVWKTPDDWWQNGNLWDAGGTEFALLDLIGRLAGDATATQAQQEMEEFAAVFREQRIEYDRVGVEYRVSPLADMAVSDVRKTLFVLFGAVGLVLLIACANVMNLMLARSFARSREIALRLALGASRLRVVGSLLAESLLLAGFGGLAGIAVSGLATDALVGLQPGRVPRLDQV